MTKESVAEVSEVSEVIAGSGKDESKVVSLKKPLGLKKPKGKVKEEEVEVEESAEDRAISAAMRAVEKQFGKNAVMRMGDHARVPVEVISSGSLLIDRALGIGGYPRGRIVEIFGPEASGKTTLTLHAIAEAQKLGGRCLFIDAEHALDPGYAENLGVCVDDLILCQPDYGEQALDILDTMVRSGGFSIAVIDSVEALVPKQEIDGSMEDHHVGLKARMINQALRKITAIASNTKTTIIFINQLRHKIGVLFGNPETTTGGKGLPFWASIRIEVRKSAAIKEGAELMGNTTKVKVVKNKLSPPFKSADVDIVYGKGFCYEKEVLDLAVEYGVIEKSGAFYRLADEVIGQGRNKAADWLKEHLDEMHLVVKKISSVMLEK